MEIKIGSLMEGSAIVDSACMAQEAAQYAEVLKDYFLDKAEHLAKEIADHTGKEILEALGNLRQALDYLEHKDGRFETAVTLELQCPSRGETMEELEEVILNRHFELLGIGELLTLKSRTTGLFLPEFAELFERYGVE